MFRLVFILVALVVAGPVLAERSSTNYKIFADTVSDAGTLSASTNYRIEDTLGDLAPSEGTISANYRAKAGFQELLAEPLLTFSVSASSLALSPSPLSTTAVSTTSHTLNVTTNAFTGFSVAVTEDHDLQNTNSQTISDVTDGSVDVGGGDSEYGIAVAGNDAAFGDDRSLSATPRTVMTRSTFGSSREATVTYRATVSVSQQAGDYSHTATYIVTGNF